MEEYRVRKVLPSGTLLKRCSILTEEELKVFNESFSILDDFHEDSDSIKIYPDRRGSVYLHGYEYKFFGIMSRRAEHSKCLKELLEDLKDLV